MSFAGLDLLAIAAAAVAAFLFGGLWYGLLGAAWMKAVGMAERPRPEALPFVVAFAALLVMAYLFAGLLGHLGAVDVRRGLLSGFFAWLGFVAPVLVVNHRFQRESWSLTLIDGGHWLGVLLVMGLVLGLFGT